MSAKERKRALPRKTCKQPRFGDSSPQIKTRAENGQNGPNSHTNKLWFEVKIEREREFLLASHQMMDAGCSAPILCQPLSEYGFAYGLKTETCQFQRNFSCEPHGQKRKHILSEYRLSTVASISKMQFGMVGSTFWIGSEYGFVILLDESA